MPPTIRVATYNLYLGADVTVIFEASSREDLAGRARVVRDQVLATDFAGRAAAIARLLVREGVDLVGLQEVARWSRTVEDGTAQDGVAQDGAAQNGAAQNGAAQDGAGGVRVEVWLDFLEALLAALATEGVEYVAHACTANFRGGATIPGEGETSVLGHNVVLVRRGSGVRVTDERVGDFSRTLDIRTDMPELVLNVARSWGLVDVDVHGRPLRFVNTHLEAWDAEVRGAQREELLDAVGGFAGPVVVVGDFNAEPETVGMPPEYADAWEVAGEGTGLTCGQSADLLGPSALASRIDYVWVRDARVARCRVVGERPEDRTASGLWPSDHACVVADVVV